MAPNQSFACRGSSDTFIVSPTLSVREQQVLLDLVVGEADVAQPVVAHVGRRVAVEAVVDEELARRSAARPGRSSCAVGKLSHAMPALAGRAPARAAARGRATTAGGAGLFSSSLGLRGSVRGEGDAIGHRLEDADVAPPRHQQEEAEVEQRAELRDVVADGDGGWSRGSRAARKKTTKAP